MQYAVSKTCPKTGVKVGDVVLADSVEDAIDKAKRSGFDSVDGEVCFDVSTELWDGSDISKDIIKDMLSKRNENVFIQTLKVKIHNVSKNKSLIIEQGGTMYAIPCGRIFKIVDGSIYDCHQAKNECVKVF